MVIGKPLACIVLRILQNLYFSVWPWWKQELLCRFLPICRNELVLDILIWTECLDSLRDIQGKPHLPWRLHTKKSNDSTTESPDPSPETVIQEAPPALLPIGLVLVAQERVRELCGRGCSASRRRGRSGGSRFVLGIDPGSLTWGKRKKTAKYFCDWMASGGKDWFWCRM